MQKKLCYFTVNVPRPINQDLKIIMKFKKNIHDALKYI